MPAPAKPHLLSRIDGGFAYSYRGDDHEIDGLLAWVRIYASYRRRSSKASPKARFADFDGSIDLSEIGAGTLDHTVEPRRMVFNLTDVAPGYELRVTGFDAKRDIELRMEAGVNA